MKTIQDWKEIKNTDNITDWYHTFWELYKHRIHLFIALCKYYNTCCSVEQVCWRSKKHNDWTSFDWRFILQLETTEWQISYHLPIKYWDKCIMAEELEKSNKWDWHSSDDVLERLLKI